MGNCTGIFNECAGDNSSVKKVDQDAIRVAVDRNNEFTNQNIDVDFDFYNKQENLNKITKIQAHGRGFASRQALGKMKEQQDAYDNAKFEHGSVGDDTRVKHPPVTLATGAVYTGEWKNGQRDGYGTQ